MHVVDALHSAAETGTALRGSCTQLNKEHVTRTREAEVLSCPPETIEPLLRAREMLFTGSKASESPAE